MLYMITYIYRYDMIIYIYDYICTHALLVVTFIFVEPCWFPRHASLKSHPLGGHTCHHAAVAVHIGTVPELLRQRVSV